MSFDLFDISGSVGLDINPALQGMKKAIDLSTELAKDFLDLEVSAVQAAAGFEKTRNSLAAFTGGVNLANKELQDIDRVARNTAGLRLEDAEKGYVKLRDLGFQADTTKNLIAGLAKEKLLSNVDDSAVDKVITKLSQMSISTAKFSGDLRTLIKTMPSLRDAFSNAFGTLDPKKLKTFFASDPDAAFKKLSDAMANTKGASGGLDDAIGKLEDAWTQAERALGAPLLDEVTHDVKLLTNALYDNMGVFQKAGEGTSDFITGLRKLSEERPKDDWVESWNNALDAIGKKINEYNPAYQFVKNTQAVGAQESLRNVPVSIDPDAESLQGHKSNAGALARQAAQEEQFRKDSIAGTKDYTAAISSIYKDQYAVQDALLASHLQNSKEDEIKTLQDRQNAKTAYLRNELSLQTNSFDRLIDLEKDDDVKVAKLRSDKAKTISQLNSQIAVNEYNTAREIAEKQKEILDQQRQDLISYKNFQIQEIQGTLQNLDFNVHQQVSGTNEVAGLNNLISAYRTSFQKITQLTKEQYLIQLQDEKLTSQQRINIQKQMFLDIQSLARDNAKTILQIGEDQAQKIIGQLDSVGNRTKSLTDFQKSVTGNLFDSAFGGNITSAGIQNTMKAFGDTSGLDKLIAKLTEADRAQLQFEKDAAKQQTDLTNKNVVNLKQQYADQPDVLKDKLVIEQKYLTAFLAGNQKIQDDLQKSIDDTAATVNGGSEVLGVSLNKLNAVLAGAITPETIEKLKFAPIK